MRKLNVLVACEESQTICKEFRALGHEAFSCDLQECSGGHPEWHIMEDAFDNALTRTSDKTNHPHLRHFKKYLFYTMDGQIHGIDNWDLVIAHPPCTYLARCGERLMNVDRYGDYAKERLEERENAVEFFMKFTKIDCKHWVIENPVGCMTKRYREPNMIVQPWMWFDNVKKSTCLWTKGLPNLVPYTAEEPELDLYEYDKNGHKVKVDRFFTRTRRLPKEERQRQRSKTFPGFAHALATQYSAYLQTVTP